MKKLLIIVLIFLVAVTALYFILKNRGEESCNREYTMTNLSGKKIAIIIAFKDFKDEEYLIPRGILEKAGADIRVVSDELGMASGVDGEEVKVDIKLHDLDVSEFDAVVFVGGSGALDHLDNQDSYRIAEDAVSQNKVLAAICISPVILAKAGVLKGKKATVWTDAFNKGPKKILEENSAEFQDKDVVIDGKIITANGPGAAGEFGKAIIHNFGS